jgi:guanine nucleotide-binding protein subunit alpha, other
MWFETTAFVVLLNKVHLFREKLASGMSPIRKYFPEYRGKSTDIKTAEEFFANKFRNVFPDRGRQFHVHYINATDTDSTKKTLESIQEMIVHHNLYDISTFRVNTVDRQEGLGMIFALLKSVSVAKLF